MTKKESKIANSKETAKERLHLVLMQDRANVSADFLDLMKQEIIEVIKKYIDIDEGSMDVRLTNKENNDGTNGAPALYANIPIVNIKDEVRQTAQVQKNPAEEQNKKTKQNEQAEKVKKENTKKENTKKENTKKEDKEEKSAKQEDNIKNVEQEEHAKEKTKN